jgi:hypothetical protein
MAQFLIANGAMQTTAAFVSVTTGTAIKTMLQVKPSATLAMKIFEWGYSLDSAANTVSAKIELIETDVAATVTASVANDLTKWDALALLGGDPTTNLIQVGTTSTGYTASAEGTATVVRNLDTPQYETASTSFTAKFAKQFPLGREPILQISKFARIRVTFATTAALMYCYMIVEL